ncbi:hypothetical protein M426DRAFT_321562 [Hypoxylon sp. CI-4A]|nr:hypothetical protein M426DRAFT_321562 [Hypoxylon sp. CI-4A]
MSPLHLASRFGYVEIAKILFERGAQSRVAGGQRNQSAWLLYVRFLFESRDKNEELEVLKKKAGYILKHADMEDRTDATARVDTDEDLRFLADVMGIYHSEIWEYKFVSLAKTSHTRELVEAIGSDVLGPDNNPETALQWAAFHGRYVVVWWLLKNSLQVESDLSNARMIAEYKRDQDSQQQDKPLGIQGRGKKDTKGKRNEDDSKGAFKVSKDESEFDQSAFFSLQLTIDILIDPPPMKSTFADLYDEPSNAEKLKKAEDHPLQAIIVDFYQQHGQIDMLRRTRLVHEVVYSETDKEGGRGGPEGIMEKARLTMENMSFKAASKKPYKQDEFRMRWIHLPANNMEWMEVIINKFLKDNLKTDSLH